MPTPQEILDVVSVCVCAALPDEVLCCATAAEPVVLSCCPGQAWVRIVAIEPSATGPAADYSPCGPMTWKMQLELGIARCAPDDCGGENACCAAEEAVAALVLADRALLMRAVTCCSGLPARDLAYGKWAVDTTGGCMSGTLQIYVRFEDGCACA